MRVEPHDIGSYVHAIKRGTKGLPIVRDEADKWRFLKSLFYLNNKNGRIVDWENELHTLNTPMFTWPQTWPKQKKLVEILAFTLLPNHFHLLMREITENGIALFMQGLGTSMSLRFNDKYKENGSIFQGGYKGKTAENDEYVKRLAVYIMVKNSFQLFPGGIVAALKDFDTALEWSITYPFSSLADYAGNRNSPLQ